TRKSSARVISTRKAELTSTAVKSATGNSFVTSLPDPTMSSFSSQPAASNRPAIRTIRARVLMTSLRNRNGLGRCLPGRDDLEARVQAIPHIDEQSDPTALPALRQPVHGQGRFLRIVHEYPDLLLP